MKAFTHGSRARLSTLGEPGKMVQVKEGDTITMHYTGSLDDGTIFDSSEGGEPLSFKVGASQVMAGFDEGVRGMQIGESRQISIPADQAYGRIPRRACEGLASRGISAGCDACNRSGL